MPVCWIILRKYVDKNGCGRMNLCRWLDIGSISFIMPTQKIPDSESWFYSCVTVPQFPENWHGLFKGKSFTVVITGQMGQPAELVSALEKSGNVVYQLMTLKGLIASCDELHQSPLIVIYMAHGRMGDYAMII